MALVGRILQFVSSGAWGPPAAGVATLWVPSVAASFSRDEVLPPGAERQALVRGVQVPSPPLPRAAAASLATRCSRRCSVLPLLLPHVVPIAAAVAAAPHRDRVLLCHRTAAKTHCLWS